MRSWTEEQVQFVSDNAGWLSNEELARRLGKSPDAVKLYRSRKNMGWYVDNIYTASQVSVELGRTRNTVAKWFRKGLLFGKYASWKCQWGKTPMLFREEDIVAFLKKYPDKFLGRAIPNRYFANVVKERR